MDERVRLHREAMGLLDALVADVSEDDLARDSPCEGWTLGDLLAHELGQHLGFAQAVREGDAPVESYAPVPFTTQGWRESVEAVLAAFAAADPERAVVERELAPMPLMFPVIVGAQLLDVVVHSWDVARSLGREFTPPGHLVQAVAVIAAAVPASASGPGGPFAPPVQDLGGTPWERTLQRLGRTP